MNNPTVLAGFMTEDKRLESMKDPDGSRWVALDDIEGKQQAKLHSESPVRYQLKQAQALITELQETVGNQDARFQMLEQELATLLLVDFAHQHEISVHAIKKGYYEHAFALTVHQREGTVKRNHNDCSRQGWPGHG